MNIIKWTPLDSQIQQKMAKNINQSNIHYLECGEEHDKLIILLHGFPEISFSWRKIMVPLANAGYHVVAPDRRGHGQTTNVNNTNWHEYNSDIQGLSQFNEIRDVIGLTNYLGYTSVHSIIGHDAGSPIAGWCAMVRPDIFKSVVLMSSCFTTPLKIASERNANAKNIFQQLFIGLRDNLPNRPRRHYFDYHASPEANEDIMNCPGGLEAYFRAYYHQKSADWEGNDNVRKLLKWDVNEFAKLPTYYVMDDKTTMPETVLKHMPSKEFISTISSRWFPDSDVKIYADEYRRTTFQGGLNGYRYIIGPSRGAPLTPEKEIYAGKSMEVPSAFISGSSDWGPRQMPGSFEAMKTRTCKGMMVKFVEGAGHWVQQEQPEKVVEYILTFFDMNNSSSSGGGGGNNNTNSRL